MSDKLKVRFDFLSIKELNSRYIIRYFGGKCSACQGKESSPKWQTNFATWHATLTVRYRPNLRLLVGGLFQTPVQPKESVRSRGRCRPR